MKKLITLITICISNLLLSQQAFWTSTSYKGAFPVTDGTSRQTGQMVGQISILKIPIILKLLQP